MFIQNKYTSCYYRIVSRGKSRLLDKATYVERHHIIPKSLGGSNDPNNLVRLTAREHAICHLLLVKMTEGKDKSKMACAAWRMVFQCRKHQRHQFTSRQYASIKEAMANSKRGTTGRKHSEETKQKISKSKIGKPRTFTTEWIANIRKSQIGLKKSPCSEERKKNISAAKTGVKLGSPSDDHRQKISESKKGKKRYTDPITGRRYMA